MGAPQMLPLDFIESDPADFSGEKHLEFAVQFEIEGSNYTEGDEKAGRYFYAAARALRECEFRSVGNRQETISKIIANLEKAIACRFFMGIGWLATIYSDGQSIVEPDIVKARALRSLEHSEIRRIKSHYWNNISGFLERHGFNLYKSTHAFMSMKYGYCYVKNDFCQLGVHLRQQLSVGKLKLRNRNHVAPFSELINKERHVNFHKIFQPQSIVEEFASKAEALDYMLAIQAVDLWCEREERLAFILRALDQCIHSWFHHDRFEI